MRTANPALNDAAFQRYSDYADDSRMTLNGTVNKTGFLLLLAIVPAVWIWQQVYEGGATNVQGWMIGGAIGGLIAAMVTIFKPTLAPFSAPVYAALEGLFLGGISAFFEMRYPGIVIQAIALTFGTLAVLLMAYRSGLIRATENFKLGIVAATGAVFMIYMATMVLGFFGVSIPYIHGSGVIGILFSLVVVVIAALNLVLDFDFIERGVEQGAPKYMEWYGAFGLMVTLVWLYLEILRLLSKLQGRR
jgi:uncharacterized YccA/Bax inhibitor family protein